MKILLIDGLNAMRRAILNFKSSNEEPSYTIVYNFFRSLRATIEEFEPDKVFFCLEGPRNFRYKIYPEYKANRIIKLANEKRIKAEENFNRQKIIILELLKNLPITIVKSDEFECDDVIATLAEHYKEDYVIIISTDTDFIQLLQKNYKYIQLYNPTKKSYVFAPDYFYLTHKIMHGDTTDNIHSLVNAARAELCAKNVKELAIYLDESEEHRANYALNKDLIELKIISNDKLEFFTYDSNFEKIKLEFETMKFQSMITDKYWKKFCDTFQSLR